jgi:hypothetical protein
MAFNTGYLISNVLLQIFSCTPVEKYFEPEIPGHCVSLIPPDIAWGAMSMASDFAIAILPLPVVWSLKLDRRDKVLLSLVFLSGLVAFTTALARWIIATVDLTSEDRTWVAGLAFLFSVVEVNTGIICGCTPTFRPLFKYAREYARQTRRKSSSAQEGEHKQLVGSPRNSQGPSTNTPTVQSPTTSVHTTDGTIIIGHRPSIAPPLNSGVSMDFLHLPKEGTHFQPELPNYDEKAAPHQMV